MCMHYKSQGIEEEVKGAAFGSVLQLVELCRGKRIQFWIYGPR